MKCCCKNTYHSLALDKDTLLDQIYAKPMTLKKKNSRPVKATRAQLLPHSAATFLTASHAWHSCKVNIFLQKNSLEFLLCLPYPYCI